MDIAAHEDIRQSEEYGKYISRIGWTVVKVSSSKMPNPNEAPMIQIFIRRLGWFGSIAKIQRVHTPMPWPEIEPVLKKNKVWMTKVEPLNIVNSSWLIARGFMKDGNPFLSSKTIRIDLNNIQLKKDARYCIRKARSAEHPKGTSLREQAHVVRSNDFDGFYSMWRRANGVKHLWTPSKKDFDSLVNSFDKKCFCITIGDQAGALVLMHDKVAYYYYAGALPEGKRLQLPYLVVWECMQQAKKLGCNVWDFEGIFDPRWPNKDIKGYTHFKKSFGGGEVDFPGSFTKWGWWL